MQIKIFSFFSGAGFLDLGFETEGYSVVFVNEYCRAFLNAYQHSRRGLNIPAPEHGYYEGSITDPSTGARLRQILKGRVREGRNGKNGERPAEVETLRRNRNSGLADALQERSDLVFGE